MWPGVLALPAPPGVSVFLSRIQIETHLGATMTFDLLSWPTLDTRPVISGGSATRTANALPWNTWNGGDAKGTTGTPYYTGGNAWSGIGTFERPGE